MNSDYSTPNNYTIESKPVRFKHFKVFHSVALRILLIDDKVGGDLNNRPPCRVQDDGSCKDYEFKDVTTLRKFSINECPDENCQNCKCKLCTVKRLMDNGKNGEKDNNDGKRNVFDGIGLFNDYYYWDENSIECFYCPTVIKDFITGEAVLKNSKGNYYNRIHVSSIGEKDQLSDKSGDNPLEIECDFKPMEKTGIGKYVQIIGVRDVRTALLLMSKYKFDMIFCDYLLDKKENGSEEREYSNQLFDFLSYDYKKEIENEEKKETTDEKRISRLKVLSQLRRDVLDNRGPLDKLWIMPITGFNQTFIQDLYRNKIDLIGHKWNISNGADPITTPWQFLYHFNKFIELQLKYCVYDMPHLLRFLLYTWEDLDDKLKRNKGSFFYTFQAFMGSEYANFMRRYGNRHIIQRDAYKDESDEKSDKSIFATYIWREFYANHKNRDVIELNRLIQRFLYQAATMHNDRDGQQRLEETFGQLCFFIDINKKVRDAISNENDLSEKLDEALKKFREKMDELTSNRHNENRKG